MAEFERMYIINLGSYGAVYKARERRTGNVVAVKVQASSPWVAMEIDIHKSVSCHPSIVKLKRVGRDDRGRTYMAMEYIENDLEQLIARRIMPLTSREVKGIMRQLLEGVSFLHDRGILHRDLKPSNVLITNKGALKICDFGLSIRWSPEAKEEAGDGGPAAGTLLYKAPEILLGRRAYSPAIDVWAVGCIMAELLLKRALFDEPSEIRQLTSIRAAVESPSADGLRLKLSSVRRSLTQSGLDLLERLLAYDPKKRITAKEALNHSWFRENSYGVTNACLGQMRSIYTSCYRKGCRSS